MNCLVATYFLNVFQKENPYVFLVSWLTMPDLNNFRRTDIQGNS